MYLKCGTYMSILQHWGLVRCRRGSASFSSEALTSCICWAMIPGSLCLYLLFSVHTHPWKILPSGSAFVLSSIRRCWANVSSWLSLASKALWLVGRPPAAVRCHRNTSASAVPGALSLPDPTWSPSKLQCLSCLQETQVELLCATFS